MTDELIQRWLDKHKQMKSKKDRWNDLWQYCGEYVHGKKQSFTEFRDEGTFLNRDVFDSTAPKANRKMAASLIGLLWQSGGKSIRLNPVKDAARGKDEAEYFDWMTDQVIAALDDPRAGMSLALEEYMIDQGCFGTSGIGIFEGIEGESELLFNAWGVDQICIEEGRNGYVRTIYREYEISVLQAVEDYGKDNLSEATQKKLEEGKTSDKVRFLHIISPRSSVDPNLEGNKAMAFMSLTIEMESKKAVKESGFEEMPVPISRFYKRNGEVYGRSPAMDALPDILEINATKEARISAIEKSLDPPLGVYDDSVLGNEEIDTSAGSINVFAVTGRIGKQAPIFPLYTVETIREVDKSVLELRESIDEHFNIDKLLDFNNQTQMTLGEAQMRSKIRSEALGSLFTRQIHELFTPLIERSISILYRKGKLGVIKGSEAHRALAVAGENPRIIPEKVAKLMGQGLDFFEIRYLTPAARLMETAEAEGIIRAWEFAGLIGEVVPNVFDKLNADRSLEIVGKNAGAPSSVFIDDETIGNMRKARAEQQAAQAKIEMARQGAEAKKAVGEGESAMAQAQKVTEAPPE